MRFSIITVSYNAEKTIRETIESTIVQTFQDFEIIVKDGLSSDGTIAAIPKDERINLLENRDKGIYDAMNQAISASSGEYLVFMNCGDRFACNTVLQDVDLFITQNPNVDVIYGNYSIGGDEHSQPEKLTDFYLYRTPLCHQSMIIKRALFDKFGAYRVKYNILADYDFTQRVWWKNREFKHVDLIVCDYLGGGVSETREGMQKKEMERREILKNYYPMKMRLKYDLILVMSLRKFRIWLMTGNGPEWLCNLYKKMSNCMNS